MTTKEEVFGNGLNIEIRELVPNIGGAPKFNLTGKVIFLEPNQNLPAIDGMEIRCRKVETVQQEYSRIDDDDEVLTYQTTRLCDVDALSIDTGRFVLLVDENGDMEEAVFAIPASDIAYLQASIVENGQPVTSLQWNPANMLRNVSDLWATKLAANRAGTISSTDLEEIRDQYSRTADLLRSMVDHCGLSAREINWCKLTLNTFLDPNNTPEHQREYVSKVMELRSNRYILPDASDDLLAKLAANPISRSGVGAFGSDLLWNRIGPEAYNYGVRVVGQKVFGEDFDVGMTDVVMSIIPRHSVESFLTKINEHRHVGRANIRFDQIPGYAPDVNIYEMSLGEDGGSCALLHVVDHTGHYAYCWPATNVELRPELRAEDQMALSPPFAGALPAPSLRLPAPNETDEVSPSI